MTLNPFNSWSLSVVRRWHRYMTLRSAWRYRKFALRRSRNDLSQDELLELDLRGPISATISLREADADHETLREIADSQVYRPVIECVSNCRYVVDLGANIGLASLYFLTQYPDCVTFCVEPDRNNFGLLEQNLRPFAEQGRCCMLRSAVWGRETLLAVGAAPNRDGFNCITVEECVGEASDAPNVVQGVTMSEVFRLSGFPRIDLLKVDIEGAEVELFTGDSTWLERVAAIAIEFHDGSRRRSDFDRLMAMHGFAVEDRGGHTVVAIRQAQAVATTASGA